MIEDDESDAFLIEEHLASSKMSDFEVVHIDRVSKVEEQTAETSFDVALLDLSLPDSFGLDNFILGYRDGIGGQEMKLSGLSLVLGDASSVTSGGIQALIYQNVTTTGEFSDAILQGVSSNTINFPLDAGHYTFEFDPPILVN